VHSSALWSCSSRRFTYSSATSALRALATYGLVKKQGHSCARYPLAGPRPHATEQALGAIQRVLGTANVPFGLLKSAMGLNCLYPVSHIPLARYTPLSFDFFLSAPR
jgi:hypothetical protein